jgi:hypothetical protein
MRGPFIRETMIRTVTYLVAAVPIVILFWYLKIINNESGLLNAAIGILLFDLAFGLAFIRTVYNYRHRVKIVYRLYFDREESPGKPEELPPDVDLDTLFNQMAATEAPPPPGPEGAFHSSSEDTSIEMQATFECAKCHAEVTVPISEIDTVKNCPCGGELIQT